MLEEDNVRQRTLSEAEIASIVAHAGPQLGPMFLAYYDTGIRRAELRLLPQSCLDLDRKAIRLRPEDTKTGRARVVPLTERVVEAIRSLSIPQHQEYVFVNPDTGEPWSDPYRLFKRVCRPHERAAARFDRVGGHEGDRAHDEEHLRSLQHRR